MLFLILIQQQDTEILMKDINNLIGFYLGKLNKINKSSIEDKLTKHKEILKSYDVQIEHQKEKEKHTDRQLRTLNQNANSLDLDKLKDVSLNYDHSRLEDKKSDMKANKKKMINFGKLIENVNAGLHENKHNTLEQYGVLQEKLKIAEGKMRLYGDYISAFNQVKVEAKKILDKKLEKETIKDLKNIMVKLTYDQETLKVRRLLGYKFIII